MIAHFPFPELDFAQPNSFGHEKYRAYGESDDTVKIGRKLKKSFFLDFDFFIVHSYPLKVIRGWDEKKNST